MARRFDDYGSRLVLETEGTRGAAERGWLGETARIAEIERQREEEAAHRAAEEAHRAAEEAAHQRE